MRNSVALLVLVFSSTLVYADWYLADQWISGCGNLEWELKYPNQTPGGVGHWKEQIKVVQKQIEDVDKYLNSPDKQLNHAVAILESRGKPNILGVIARRKEQIKECEKMLSRSLEEKKRNAKLLISQDGKNFSEWDINRKVSEIDDYYLKQMWELNSLISQDESEIDRALQETVNLNWQRKNELEEKVWALKDRIQERFQQVYDCIADKKEQMKDAMDNDVQRYEQSIKDKARALLVAQQTPWERYKEIERMQANVDEMKKEYNTALAKFDKAMENVKQLASAQETKVYDNSTVTGRKEALTGSELTRQLRNLERSIQRNNENEKRRQELQQQEVQRRIEAEVRKAEQEYAPQMRDAEQRLRDSERSVRQGERELQEIESGLISSASESQPKKKSSLEEALGY